MENQAGSVLLGTAFIRDTADSITPCKQQIRSIGWRTVPIFGTSCKENVVKYVSDRDNEQSWLQSHQVNFNTPYTAHIDEGESLELGPTDSGEVPPSRKEKTDIGSSWNM